MLNASSYQKTSLVAKESSNNPATKLSKVYIGHSANHESPDTMSMDLNAGGLIRGEKPEPWSLYPATPGNCSGLSGK